MRWQQALLRIPKWLAAAVGTGLCGAEPSALGKLRSWLRSTLLRLASLLVSFATLVRPAQDGESMQLTADLETLQERVRAARIAHTAKMCRIPRPRFPSVDQDGSPRRGVRIFIDGAFDLTHFGHMNAFRQAKALGDFLVVGVNSDESIRKSKGMLPVLNDAERQEAIAACRFVDEVVPASPYIMTEEYIRELTQTHGIDYFVHGDDPCIVDGRDVYEAAKRAGQFVTIPRTESISTTDVVGRLLLLSTDHHKAITSKSAEHAEPSGSFASKQSRFLVTSQLLKAFSASLPQGAKPKGKVVYVDGVFDMFHAGHTSLLRQARALGDYVIAGVHSDADVNRQRGANYPIMAMHERVLSVLGCKYVDDVLLDAPWVVSREMVATLDIAVVVRGTLRDGTGWGSIPNDPHQVAQDLGIHVTLESAFNLTVDVIAERLQARRDEIQARNHMKRRAEEDWYRQKHGMSSET